MDLGQGKGDGHATRAGAQALETGVCIICGERRRGTPACPSPAVAFARWLRLALGQPKKHTVACSEHLAEARQRRAKFDRKKRDYATGAALFFAFMVAGGLVFGARDLRLIPAALAGAAFVALLPYFYYFPSFGK